MKVLTGDPRVELACQGFRHNDEEQRAEYRALVNTNVHLKLFTVPLTNTNTAPRISIHPLDQLHNPLHTKFSQRPLDDLPRHLIKHLLQVYKGHVESLVGSCLTTKIASVVPLPGTKPNWSLSVDTRMRPSTILSRTFMTCSISLRPL